MESLSGCSYALANGGGVSGRMGLRSSSKQIFTVLCIIVLTYSVGNIYIKHFTSRVTLYLRTKCLWNWNYFWSISFFCFGNAILILSFSAFVKDCGLPKFSLKCIAAINNLY